jgi:glycosyltransferase involved in cell wall biosynthesis
MVLRMPGNTVAHVHLSEGGSFLREGAIVMAARARGLRCVITLHGAEFTVFSVRHRRLVRAVLRAASVVIALSEDVGDIVKRIDGRVRVEVLPNPIYLDVAAGPTRETRELVLFAGEIGVRKGADVLARAWADIASRRPQATCIMVGPQTELTIGPAERLEVRGSVSRREARDLIREARVIALPSRAEALPMLLLEAAAAGRPFVSTPVGGIPRISDGGMLVPVGDAAALTDALHSFLASPELAHTAGLRGRRICAELMDPETIGAQLRSFYGGDA